MEWVKVDSKNLTDSWQLFTPSLVQGSLFRITQLWDIYPQGAKALIVQSLTNQSPFEFFGTRVFYPSENIIIKNLAIPTDFLNAEINSRYLLIKFYSRRTFTFNWNITIENFIKQQEQNQAIATSNSTTIPLSLDSKQDNVIN